MFNQPSTLQVRSLKTSPLVTRLTISKDASPGKLWISIPRELLLSERLWIRRALGDVDWVVVDNPESSEWKYYIVS